MYHKLGILNIFHIFTYNLYIYEFMIFITLKCLYHTECLFDHIKST